ncbi:hypothetical protein GCM10023205_44350 [Yinghuangia aomiensis]|uniref:Ribbon-helix-helix protein, copG family n=1 Tax=Yinghuangia aomiensis TaxID=676205 RepID=A0ABP9HKU0_9ACTN
MSAAAASRKKAEKPAAAAHARLPHGGEPGPSKLAQVRLRPDELDALHEVMRVLDLSSTSEALREGLRLLSREAAEVGAARELRTFYGGQPAPLPAGTADVTEDELAEADRMQW